MRSLFFGMALAVILGFLIAPPTDAQIGALAYAQARDDFAGQITFSDGRTVQYVSLDWGTGQGNVAFSRDITDMKRSSLELPQLRLRSVSRIDFAPLTERESNIIKSLGLFTYIRRGQGYIS